MADAVWPVGLPQEAITAGLEETTPTLTVRSEMDVGPAKVRRRITANVRLISLSLKLTRAQVAIFDAFYTTTCAGGALPFSWLHPRTGNAIDYRFVGQPRYSANAPRLASELDVWDVPLTLEALPGTEVTGPPDPPPDGDEGGHMVYAPPSQLAIEEIAGEFAIETDYTDWIIFDAAPLGMEELIVLSSVIDLGTFEDDFFFTNPTTGIDALDPEYDATATYETGVGAFGGGFGGGPGGVSGGF